MKRSVVAAIATVLLLALGALPASAQALPDIPHAFYGDVTVNGSPAPAGTKVEAEGPGVVTAVPFNPLTTTKAGEYGGEEWDKLKLVVQGNVADGTTLKFKVNGVAAAQTAQWHSGQITRLDLTVNAAPVAPLSIATNAASGISTTAANLNGSLVQLGGATSVMISFQWGTTLVYGNETPAQSINAPGSFTATISGLLPDTIYHYRVKVVTGQTTTFGTDQTFRTTVVPPVVAISTGATSAVSSTTATLYGSLTQLSGATSAIVSFQWGSTQSYGNETAGQTLTAPGSFTATLSGLTASTTYNYRARVVAGQTTMFGANQTFTTSAAVAAAVVVGGGGGGGGGGGALPVVIPPAVVAAPPPAPTPQAVAAPPVPAASSSQELKRSIETLPPQTAAAQLAAAPLLEAAKGVQDAPAAKSAEVIAQISPAISGRLFEQIQTSKAVDIIDEMSGTRAAQVVEQVRPDKAAQILSQASNAKAADTLSKMAPEKAGQVMERLTPARLEQVLPAMPVKAIHERLPEVSTTVQFALKPQVLFQSLPTAPTEQLVGEIPPAPGKGLEKPKQTGTSASSATYSTEARSGEFSVLVGTPAPIEKIMAKFKQTLTSVQVQTEQLSLKPAYVQPEPPGDKVNTYLSIELSQNAALAIEVGYIRFQVAKSWLKDNNIHKWSVILSRYDTDTNSWMSLPTKRVDEDVVNVYYTATTPRFSVFAISGSPAVPEQEFQISELEVNPTRATAGQPITITASITNLAGAPRSFAVPLWINGAIETSQIASLTAGGKAKITYTISRGAGNYEFRLDRQIASFQIAPAPVPTPAPETAPEPAPLQAPEPSPTPAPADLNQFPGDVFALAPVATPVPTPTPQPTPSVALPPPVLPETLPVPAPPAPTYDFSWWWVAGLIALTILGGLRIYFVRLAQRRTQ